MYTCRPKSVSILLVHISFSEQDLFVSVCPVSLGGSHRWWSVAPGYVNQIYDSAVASRMRVVPFDFLRVFYKCWGPIFVCWFLRSLSYTETRSFLFECALFLWICLLFACDKNQHVRDGISMHVHLSIVLSEVLFIESFFRRKRSTKLDLDK